MKKLKGSILTPSGWQEGEIDFNQEVLEISGKITELPKAPYIMPGFVDLHIHGGHGHDMMRGYDAIQKAAKFHADHGTTAILATSVTAPISETESFLQDVARLVQEPPKGGARILGAHLEGPFISPKRLGAQPDFAIKPDLELIARWLRLAPVRVVTLAPEEDTDSQAVDLLLAAGVQVQIGHSLCDYAEAARLFTKGCGATHLYNAMSGLAHRGNGAVGAALAHAEYAEIIPDLIHVEAGAILAARRAIPRLYGVTDSTSGAGMPDGEFRLGAHVVAKKDGRMTLADGTLAGSVLTMDKALSNLVSIGLPLAEASRRLSQYPADWIKEPKIGRLIAGANADVLVFDEKLNLEAVYVDGQAL